MRNGRRQRDPAHVDSTHQLSPRRPTRLSWPQPAFPHRTPSAKPHIERKNPSEKARRGRRSVMAHEGGGGGGGGGAHGAAAARAVLDLDVDWKKYWLMGNTNVGEAPKRKLDDLLDEQDDEEPMPEGTNPQELITYVLEERFLCADERVNRDNRSLVGLLNDIGSSRRSLIRLVDKRGSLGRAGKIKLKYINKLVKDAENLYDGILKRGGTPKPIPLHFQDKKVFY